MVNVQGGGRKVQHLAGVAESGEHVRQPHPRRGCHKALPEGPALLQCQEAIPCTAGHFGAHQQGLVSFATPCRVTFFKKLSHSVISVFLSTCIPIPATISASVCLHKCSCAIACSSAVTGRDFMQLATYTISWTARTSANSRGLMTQS